MIHSISAAMIDGMPVLLHGIPPTNFESFMYVSKQLERVVGMIFNAGCNCSNSENLKHNMEVLRLKFVILCFSFEIQKQLFNEEAKNVI